jgi:hypothetical protein
MAEEKTLCLADTSTVDPTCRVVVVYCTVCVTLMMMQHQHTVAGIPTAPDMKGVHVQFK